MTETSASPFVAHDPERPLQGTGDGPLAGLTVAVKDCYDIAGERTGIGSPDWLADHAPPAVTADAVRRVLDAGATVVGKTVCDEFMYSITGANAHYGTPLNPRAVDRLPGGSSSGSASAVAGGSCDLALGTDTGGSIRIPAALCGLYGLRTTHGRVAMTGIQSMAPSFDSAGWLAPGPGVLRAAGRVLLGGDAERRPIGRVLLATDALEVADAECAAAVEDFLARAASELPAPELVRLAAEGLAAWSECFRVIQAFETWQTFGAWITAHRPTLGAGVDERMAFAATVEESAAAAARMLRAAVTARLRDVLRPGTVVILPTAPCPAPLLRASAGEVQHFRTRSLQLTCAAGLGGLPQLSLPIRRVRSAPVGLSVLGWRGADETLLDLACTLARHAGV
ncbi:MAG: amidase [Candidatus Dormibacteraeota bacterium]|uniref:Amidase n=1 Tax=Candidatus Aeolococcus gillhamiae TaxID=3127015 RepID=A0A934K0F8_9BACT|nr:amidase [Candidatus Dormibacteraeota bacterium]